MAIFINKEGKILCAVLNDRLEDDIYIDDSLHSYLCQNKLICTTKEPEHSDTGGEWWFKGKEPSTVDIDYWWYI